MRSFHHVLANTLLANTTTSFLWFCLSFWIYLETRNVGLTGVINGLYMGLHDLECVADHEVGLGVAQHVGALAGTR